MKKFLLTFLTALTLTASGARAQIDFSGGADGAGGASRAVLKGADGIGHVAETLQTEVDAVKDSVNRREANFANLIGVSHPIPGIEGANAIVEFFSAVGSDRAAPPIYTFDLGMNFRIDKHTILDVGLNLGLNNAAPKVQIYTGISARF